MRDISSSAKSRLALSCNVAKLMMSGFGVVGFDQSMHGDAISCDAQVTQSAVLVHMIHLGKHERWTTLCTRQGVRGAFTIDL